MVAIGENVYIVMLCSGLLIVMLIYSFMWRMVIGKRVRIHSFSYRDRSQ